MSTAIQNRYDFVFFYDVTNGNPNGDPDAGNMPRIDPETGKGIVTDVAIKRKIRNYVQMVKEGEAGYEIYIQEAVPLNRNDLRAAEKLEGGKLDALLKEGKEGKSLKKDDPEIDRKIRDAMCSIFYDIRSFGAVMTTFVKAALNCGQVRGPVQLTFSESVEPVVPREVTITRVAITKEEDAQRKNTEMGNKFIIPYGLYRMEGHISAHLAQKTTGFSEEDLALLWEALMNLFEHDYSASRANMASRKLIIFKHKSALGNAPAHKLFDLVQTQRATGSEGPARKYQDYKITVDMAQVPEQVDVIIKE